mgnify:CR=1 FL=1
MALCEKTDSSRLDESSEKIELEDVNLDEKDKNINRKILTDSDDIVDLGDRETKNPLRTENFQRDISICPHSTMEKRFIVYGVVTFFVIIVAIVLMLQNDKKSVKLAGGAVIAAASGLSCVVMAVDLAVSGRCRRNQHGQL